MGAQWRAKEPFEMTNQPEYVAAYKGGNWCIMEGTETPVGSPFPTSKAATEHLARAMSTAAREIACEAVIDTVFPSVSPGHCTERPEHTGSDEGA